eukprot:SAG31_NODE_623_length_13492_cov_62.118196_7_plen_280_part_00
MARCAVYADGRVCISILHKPGGTAEIPDDTPASECWRPILNIEAIVVSVLSMLSDPNFNSPANMDASARYLAPLSALKDLYSDVMYHSQVQMRNDIEGFKARVRSLVEDSRCEIACARKQMQGSAMDTAASGTASFSDRSIPGRCNLPVGFEFPSEHSASAGGTAGDDFDFVSDDDGVDEDQDDEEDAAGADGLTKKEQVIISEVCEMGFEREAVVRACCSALRCVKIFLSCCCHGYWCRNFACSCCNSLVVMSRVCSTDGSRGKAERTWQRNLKRFGC